MSRIEKSAEQYIDRELLELIQSGQPMLVSGQPLRVFHPEDKAQDVFLGDCHYLDEEQLLPPFSLFEQVIPKAQQSYLAEEYRPDPPFHEDGSGRYPALQGILIDGSEVVLGIREALGFYAKPLHLDS
jgi:hypothetical protein